MRVTDSDNCKDIINKNTEKPKKVDYEAIYRMMFKNLASIIPSKYMTLTLDHDSFIDTDQIGVE